MRTGSVSVDVRDEDDERKKTTNARSSEGQKKTVHSLAGKNAFAPPPRRLSCFEQNGSVRTQR